MGITQDLLKAVDQYLLECFEKAQLHGQTTGSTQLHGQTTVCSHYWESFYYWISVITCWLNTQSNFIFLASQWARSRIKWIRWDPSFFGYLSVSGVLSSLKYQGISISLLEEQLLLFQSMLQQLLSVKSLGPFDSSLPQLPQSYSSSF